MVTPDSATVSSTHRTSSSIVRSPPSVNSPARTGICSGAQDHYGFLRLLGIQGFAGTVVMLAMLFAAELPAKKIEHGPLLVASGYLVASLTTLYFTGNSPNPAKVFGQSLFHDRLTDPRAWVFYLGPLLGALVGVFVYRYLILSHSLTQEIFKPVADLFADDSKPANN